jgi:hypothetical protein
VPIARASKIKCSPKLFEGIDCALRLPPHERPQSIDAFLAALGWQLAKPRPRKSAWRRVWISAPILITVSALAAIGYERQIAETAQYDAARGNAPKLWAYMDSCFICEFSAEANREKIALESDRARRAEDLRRYNLARGNVDTMREYLMACQIIEFCEDARRELTRIEGNLRDEEFYASARGNAAKLHEYLDWCGRACRHSDAAREEVRVLEAANNREAQVYRTALQCIRGPSACNPDDCLLPYQSAFPGGDHSLELKDEARRAADGPQCVQFRIFANKDMDGGDLGQPLRNIVYQACLSACKSHNECKAFSYDKWIKACYLKNSVTVQRSDPSSTVGVRQDLQPPPQATSPRKMERRGLEFSGNIYRNFMTGSRDSCSNICFQDPMCLAYTFRGGNCALFDDVDYASAEATAQSGVKLQPPR